MKTMTEDKARKKICPHMSRPIVTAHASINDQVVRCQGSDCMAWLEYTEGGAECGLSSTLRSVEQL